MNRTTIGDKLLYYGVNPANHGFEYLITAISIYKPGMPAMFVYNSVAEEFNTTPTRAERCIRHSRELTESFKHLDNREMIARLKWNLEAEEATP